MINDLPAGLTARHPTAEDHPRVQAVLNTWWGGLKGEAGALERALLLPRLYFQHFTGTSFLVEDPDGNLAAFLVGFLSQSEPDVAYVHFVGVDPALHGQGIGSALYRAFFTLARAHGRRYVHCITSPENTASQSFHTRLGFTASPALPDYDGPGLDRVAFTLDLAPRPARPTRRLRVLDAALALEHHPELREPRDDDWLAVVRAPEGLTVIRTAGGSVPPADRWIALYDADPDHGLDEPGLLAAVLTPLARVAIPVFTASTYHADLVLVPEQRRDEALGALRSAGYGTTAADA
ncbi:GNAT family N-acetyltransferase [Streptomyces sp. NPDC058369]|uniref:GNAT family N-acetyltransferase n=1 Tax=unclassified Streptomyces TaxID=2593676 RepID=UPI002259B561|nr:GNAT family N-acetyltransferase [Streptomyces sp. NBC_01789]MCX4448264.1 GNAT family N-acetyltransferase [Streptomyces sp. NBC_01789]